MSPWSPRRSSRDIGRKRKRTCHEARKELQANASVRGILPRPPLVTVAHRPSSPGTPKGGYGASGQAPHGRVTTVRLPVVRSCCRAGTGGPHGSPTASAQTGPWPRACDTSALVPGTGVEPVRPKEPADFTYHRSFRYHASSARCVVWTIPLPYAARHLGRGRLVSTLSHASHGLSSGLPSARPVKGSPNLTPVHPRVSPWGTPTSPLRLPVPPPGQCMRAG